MAKTNRERLVELGETCSNKGTCVECDVYLR